MFRVVLAPLIFLIHTPLQIANLALWATLIVALGCLKLIVPIKPFRRMLANVMHFCMFAFGKISVAMIYLFNPIKIERQLYLTLYNIIFIYTIYIIYNMYIFCCLLLYEYNR